MSALAEVLEPCDDLRARRRAAGLGPGAFLSIGVRASEILAHEEGESSLDAARLSAVLELIGSAEASARYRLPGRVSYQDRLAGLD